MLIRAVSTLFYTITLMGVLTSFSFQSFAGILILTPDNTHAQHLANEIKKEIEEEDIVISSNLNAVVHPELIITLGTSTLRANQLKLNAPTVAAFVSPHDFEQLDKHIQIPTAPVYSTVGPQQVIAFLQQNFATARVGYVYNDEKDAYLTSMEVISKNTPVKLVSLKLINGDLFKTYRRAFKKNAVDVMLITNSTDIYNSKNIRFALEALYREKIPAIGLSKQMVKAGAVAAIYADDKDIVAATVNQMSTYLAYRNFTSPSYVLNYSILMHKKIAQEYRLTIQGIQVDAL